MQVAATEPGRTAFVSPESMPVESRVDEARTSAGVNPLDTVWLDADSFSYLGYEIQRNCPNDDVFRRSEVVICELRITRNRKVIRRFSVEYGLKHWLRYGLFDFLGNGRKQLLVHTFSGGAHCCYDYFIFELTPKFSEVYSSEVYDSGSEIGNELYPVDINGDGVYEFHRDVMAFDYIGRGGHASATFPPVVFAFDKGKGKFELANKQYPDFVLAELKALNDGMPQWVKENEEHGAKIEEAEVSEIVVRNTFLYWVYAGKRAEGWGFFEKHYRSKSGDQYQDQFRDRFREDFKRLLHSDPTYLSIYGTAN